MTTTEFSPRPNEDIEAALSVAISPSSNGRHVVRYVQPETPYFHLGDTAWELLHRLNKDEAVMYLKNRAAKGFTGVMVVLLAEHGGLDFPNRDGEWPFIPSSESTSDKYIPDLKRPNPAYFSFLDELIPIASKLGITFWLTPTWGRYVNGGYYGSPILFNEETAYEYGYFVGHRYPFHPFILGADSNRYWNENTMTHIASGKPATAIEVKDFGPVYDAMARGLIDGEKKAKSELRALKGIEEYKTFITYHSAQVWLPNTPQTSGSAQFPESDWLTLDVVQTGHHDSHPPSSGNEEEGGGHAQTGAGYMPMWYACSSYIPIREMYNARTKDGKTRPVMDLEPHYENIHQWFNLDGPKWSAPDIRSGGWQAIFAGACGYTYGCNSIWQMHVGNSKSHPAIAPPTTAYTDWYLELDLEGSFQAGLMRKIVESLPNYFNRVPDQSFILSDTNEPKDGKTWAGDKLISGMRSTGWAAVHLPYGGEVQVDSKAAGLDEPFRIVWINPRTGGRQVVKRGVQELELTVRSPTEGSLNDDWILLLERDVVPS